HLSLQKAVDKYYLSDEERRCEMHRRLAEFFDARADPGGTGTFIGPMRALEELPFHLDGSAGDARSQRRLLGLVDLDFVHKKFDRTHDPRLAYEDHAFLFRACLRTVDLHRALQLARGRGGVSNLNSWLTNKHLGPVLRLLGFDAPLWRAAQNAFA